MFRYAVAALVCLALPCLADEADIEAQIEALQGDADGFSAAFDAVTNALRDGDSNRLAALADYPLTARANGEEYELFEPSDLADNLDTLLRPETQAAIAEQDFGDLFVNAEGVMFADGALWMAAVCRDDACLETDWRIIALND